MSNKKSFAAPMPPGPDPGPDGVQGTAVPPALRRVLAGFSGKRKAAAVVLAVFLATGTAGVPAAALTPRRHHRRRH